MNRDPFYRDILDRLGGRLDEDAFEACVADLLRREFPTLVPIRGGGDGGMDGATAGSGPFLVSTTSPDVIGNLTRSLKSYLKNGGARRSVVVATSQELTKRKRDNLEGRARGIGFHLIQIYSQAAIADRLLHEPRWCNELLALTGRPSALTVIPKSDRPLVDSRLLGRDSDLDWLRESRGDRLVIGSPGSGKTFLLRSLTKEGLALFLVDSDKTAIANAIRSQQPLAIIVDDAHLDPNVLSTLRQLRQEIGAAFAIIATGWAGDKDSLAVTLNLPASQIHELELLTRDEIVDVIKNAGLEGPRELIREIVDQSEGRPGLAVTLTLLCRTGGFRDVVFGEAITRELGVAFGRLVGERAKTTLGVFSLGGDTGLDIETVSKFCGFPVGDLQHILSRLAAGGVVREAGPGKVSVWPRTLRYILIRDTFFSSTPLDVRRLIDEVPSKTETATALIGARARGANIPWLTEFLKQVDSPQAWRHFASLGKDEATFALQHDPSLACAIGREALIRAPDEALPLLFSASVGDNRALHNSVDHPLRLVQDWIASAMPGTGHPVTRRNSLLRATAQWLKDGGNEHVATRALVIAVSPKFAQTTSDPGSGLTVTLSRAFLTYSEIESLRAIWESIIKILATMKSPDWATLLDSMHDWAYPQAGSARISEEAAPLMRAITVETLKGLLEVSRQLPAVQQRLREYGDQLGVELNTARDSEFEILFPTEDLENWEAASEKQTREVRALAADWDDLGPQQVAVRLLRLESEAAFARKTHPRLTWLLCQALADSTDSYGVWVNEFIDHGLPTDTVFPFLQQAVLSEEEGWQELSLRCLESPTYTGVGISVLLTVPNIPDSLLTVMDEKIAPYDQLVKSLSLRGEIPEATLRRLLQNKAANVATAAAAGEWISGSKAFRDSLRADCRQAVLRAEGQDHWLREIFQRDSSIAHDWLIARIEAEVGTFPYHRFEIVQCAINALTSKEKVSVLDHLCHDPESADWQLLKELIGTDVPLFQILLSRKQMSGFHLLALEAPPTDSWCEMAVSAFDAGYSPDEVAKATFPWISSGSGQEASKWNQYIRDFEPLLDHQDPRLSETATLGIRIAREREQRAIAEDRRQRVYGLVG